MTLEESSCEWELKKVLSVGGGKFIFMGNIIFTFIIQINVQHHLSSSNSLIL